MRTRRKIQILLDPLDAADAFLNRPLGCLAVSVAASLFSGALWLVDRHAMKVDPTESRSDSNKSKGLRAVRKYELSAIHGCLKLLWAAGGLFAMTYLGRALMLR